jgi:hypothetical protein
METPAEIVRTLRRIIRDDVLQSASMARAKIAVFHTFHENKVKNNLDHGPRFRRTGGEEMR